MSIRDYEVVWVKGRCPACGNSHLFVGDHGYITCSWHVCPDPCAASGVLRDDEPGGGENERRQLCEALHRQGYGVIGQIDLRNALSDAGLLLVAGREQASREQAGGE